MSMSGDAYIAVEKTSSGDLGRLRARVDMLTKSERELLKELEVIRAKHRALMGRLVNVRQDLQGVRVELDRALGDEYISRLPDEVLQEIFLRVKALNNGERWTELYLSHVSYRWHVVATATSSLWTDIRLDPFTLRLVPLYMSRSGRRELDLHINFSSSHTPSIPRFMDSESKRRLSHVMTGVLSLFIPSIGRWRSLTISGDQSLKEMLEVLKDVCAPSLQHFSAMNINGLPPALRIFRGGVPALVSHETSYRNELLERSTIISGQVTSLVAESYEYPTFCDLLHGLPNLGYLEIRRFPMYFQTLQTLVMPNLRHLVLSGIYTSQDTVTTLKTIVAPSLEKFVIDMKFAGDRFFDIGLVELVLVRPNLQRICPSLRVLSVDLPMANAETVLWFIEVLPEHITSLVLPHDSLLMRALLLNALQPTKCIKWPPLSLSPEKLAPDPSSYYYHSDAVNDVYKDDVMESLAEMIKDVDVLWPTLKTLYLKGPHTSFYSLARLLQARNEVGSPISRVVFQCPKDEHAYEFREMAKMVLEVYTDEVEVEFVD